jgi:hypothetical protein
MHSAALLASMPSAATAAARLTVEASNTEPPVAASSATCAHGAAAKLRACSATNLEPVLERRSATRSCTGA